MDEEIRKELAKPYGEVYPIERVVGMIAKKRPPLLISVGDESTCKLISRKVEPDICTYDFKCKRMPVRAEIKKIIVGFCKGSKNKFNIKNPAGSVEEGLIGAARECIRKKKGNIEIEGEEDLAALAFLAYAPPGSVILYGQPDEGIVWIDVDSRGNEFAKKMIERLRG